MNDYVIITDSGADISPENLEKWGVMLCPLTFSFDGDNAIHTGEDMPAAEFYQKMRGGSIARTSAINAETLKNALKAVLDSGRDAIYIAFSSGLSSTYSTACLVANRLKRTTPTEKSRWSIRSRPRRVRGFWFGSR